MHTWNNIVCLAMTLLARQSRLLHRKNEVLMYEIVLPLHKSATVGKNS